MNIDFPFQLDRRRNVVTDSDADHLRDMIEQLLFTMPGERVNRPDFGCGLHQFVFGPASPEVAAALELSVRSNIERWLGDLLTVIELDVLADDAALRVDLRYLVAGTTTTRTDTFTMSGPQ